MAVDFIFDAETLGKVDDSVILSIGILPCPEDMQKTYTIKELYSTGLHIKLDRDQQLKYGRKIEQDTVDWWKKQGAAARDVLINKNLVDIVQAQLTIRKFMFDNGFDRQKSKIWSRGMIDQRWWQSLCKTCQQINPDVTDFLNFGIWRDVRTALELLTGNPKGCIEDSDPNFIKHNALCDCCMDFLRFQGAYNANA